MDDEALKPPVTPSHIIIRQQLTIKWSFYKTYDLTLEAKSLKTIWFDNFAFSKVQHYGQHMCKKKQTKKKIEQNYTRICQKFIFVDKTVC